MTTAQRPHSRGRDIAWAVLAGFMALSAIGTVIGGVYGLATGDLWAALGTAPSLLISYWFGVGAWRRTTWGAIQPDGAIQPH